MSRRPQAAAAEARCSRCAAELEPEDLRCAICGLFIPAATRPVEKPKAKIVRCEACGASLTWSAEAQAPKCAFCDSVMKVEVPEDLLEQAEATLPFRVDPAQARALLGRWLKSRGFFQPSDLVGEAKLESLHALWWPAWVFSARSLVSWTADSNVGAGRADWAPHAGQTQLDFDDLLVSASRGLTLEECARLAPHFDLGTAEPTPRGPTGALTERFDVPRSGARRLILDALMEEAVARLKRETIPGTRFRKVNACAVLEGLTTRRLSMPTYVLAYRYRRSLYRVLIHGQDPSCVFGSSPISFWKVLFTIAGVLGVLAAVLALLLR